MSLAINASISLISLLLTVEALCAFMQAYEAAKKAGAIKTERTQYNDSKDAEKEDNKRS